MSFTSLVPGLNIQEKVVLYELGKACVERFQAVNGANTWWPTIDSDDFNGWVDGQDKAWWISGGNGYQDFLENICTNFVDYSINGGDFTGLDSIPMLTWSKVKTLAGIPNGWRKSRVEVAGFDPSVNDWTDYNDSMFTYGQADDGDIDGPWLAADCQAVAKVLKWTKVNDSGVLNYTKNAGAYCEPLSCADCNTATLSSWNGLSWTEGSTGYIYYIYGVLWQYSSAHKVRGYPLFTAPTADISASADVYLKFSNFLNGGNAEYSSAQENKLYKWESFGSRASTSRGGPADSATIVGADEFPLTTLGVSCPYSASAKSAACNEAKLVLKWDFDYV